MPENSGKVGGASCIVIEPDAAASLDQVFNEHRYTKDICESGANNAEENCTFDEQHQQHDDDGKGSEETVAEESDCKITAVVTSKKRKRVSQRLLGLRGVKVKKSKSDDNDDDDDENDDGTDKNDETDKNAESSGGDGGGEEATGGDSNNPARSNDSNQSSTVDKNVPAAAGADQRQRMTMMVSVGATLLQLDLVRDG